MLSRTTACTSSDPIDHQPRKASLVTRRPSPPARTGRSPASSPSAGAGRPARWPRAPRGARSTRSARRPSSSTSSCSSTCSRRSRSSRTSTRALTPETLAAVQRWRKTLLEISAQEMLHLALVQNLLTAVGAAPRFARPNFPMPAYAYPAGVRIELLPFGEAALRHFAFLERPEGMDVEDAEGFEAIEQAVACRTTTRTRSSRTSRSSTRSASSTGPSRPASSTSRAGSARSACSSGRRTPRRPRSTSAGRSSSRSPTSRPRGARDRHDRRAGRGRPGRVARRPLRAAPGHPRRLPGAQGGRPDLRARPPVVAANVRPAGDRRRRAAHHGPGDGAGDGPPQRRVRGPPPAPLALLRPHATSRPSSSQVLADVSVGLMYSAIKPLGAVVTTLPIGWDPPGVTAGPGFELFYQVDYLLPHREAAWVLMEERLRDAAAFAVRCGEAVHARPDGAPGQGGQVARAVRRPARGRDLARTDPLRSRNEGSAAIRRS